MRRIVASTIAPSPSAIAHPRDETLPETFVENVLDMTSSLGGAYDGLLRQVLTIT